MQDNMWCCRGKEFILSHHQVTTMSKTTGDLSYHPNEALAAVMVRAWSDVGFEARLLSGAHLDNKDSTKAALEEAGIFLNDVVVLTSEQYETYKPTEGQTVFVLPKKIGKPSMDTARIAMASKVAGI